MNQLSGKAKLQIWAMGILFLAVGLILVSTFIYQPSEKDLKMFREVRDSPYTNQPSTSTPRHQTKRGEIPAWALDPNGKPPPGTEYWDGEKMVISK